MKNFLLMLFLLSLILNAKQIIIEENKFNVLSYNEKSLVKNEQNIRFSYLNSSKCATTSYSKSEIQEECRNGPDSYDRILKYNSLRSYINNHDYPSNGLNYVTSLFVDDDTHHFGNFMNDCVGGIILFIIDGLLLLGWIPLLFCWKKRCCAFADCLYGEDNDCCNIFWQILTYFLAAAIFSFLIVVLCFRK